MGFVGRALAVAPSSLRQSRIQFVSGIAKFRSFRVTSWASSTSQVVGDFAFKKLRGIEEGESGPQRRAKEITGN
jgi:hypothetical protein